MNAKEAIQRSEKSLADNRKDIDDNMHELENYVIEKIEESTEDGDRNCIVNIFAALKDCAFLISSPYMASLHHQGVVKKLVETLNDKGYEVKDDSITIEIRRIT